MNRRYFIKLCSGLGAALAIGAPSFFIEGCAINVTDAINTVLNSALAILKVAEPGAAWTGDLGAAIAALEQAETQWQAGGAATLVIDALNTVEAVLAVIPATAVYSPLVDILVAGVEAVMAAFGVTATVTPAVRARIVNSPHYGKVALKGPSFLHPTWRGSYRAQWNAEAKALNLPAAELK